MKKNFWFLFGLLLAIALVMSACGGDTTPETTVDETPEATTLKEERFLP